MGSNESVIYVCESFKNYTDILKIIKYNLINGDSNDVIFRRINNTNKIYLEFLTEREISQELIPKDKLVDEFIRFMNEYLNILDDIRAHNNDLEAYILHYNDPEKIKEALNLLHIIYSVVTSYKNDFEMNVENNIENNIESWIRFFRNVENTSAEVSKKKGIKME